MNMDHCGAFEDGCWRFVTGCCSCTCCPLANPLFDPPTSKVESDTVVIKRLSKELGEAKAKAASWEAQSNRNLRRCEELQDELREVRKQ
jgi:hypothetical protein